ncbi:MAG: tetratricopeptide repeat protein [Candidatus Aminicenantaceae bacterium]
MKKQEKVEVQYIKQNTAMTIALVCLIVGFLGGIIYSTYKSGPSGRAAPAQMSAPQPAAPTMTPQQSQRILSLEKMVSADPKNQNAWLELGNLYFDSGNSQGAIRSYLKYLEMDPDNPNVLTDLGVMYRRNGQPQEALSSFEKAMAADPRHQQSRFNKGVVLMQDLGRAEEATQIWQELTVINPDFQMPSGQRLTDVLEGMKKD